MAVLSINNVQVPDDFPSREYDAVCSKTSGYSNHAAHPMLIGALNGVAYRFSAFVEYGEKLLISIDRHGPGPAHPQRYEQERDLFGFFSNGTSALESFAFAMFAVGAINVGSPNFPLITEKDERKVNWDTLQSAYAKAFSGDPVNSVLDSISSDQGFKGFYLARNILTHRAVPPRAHSLRVGNRPNSAIITRLNLSIEAAAISLRRKQVATLLTNGFDAMERFVTAHL